MGQCHTFLSGSVVSQLQILEFGIYGCKIMVRDAITINYFEAGTLIHNHRKFISSLAQVFFFAVRAGQVKSSSFIFGARVLKNLNE